MANKLKKNKALVEKALVELFGAVEVDWNQASHSVGTFYVNGKKFTYSVDSTNKGDYTLDKTKKMVKAALSRKALQWGYVDDVSDFETVFLK